MSDLEGTPRRRRRGRAVAALAIAAALVAGGLAFVLLRDGGTSYPSAWDPKIEPYVEIVEKQRELSFDHPVAVRFLDDTAFEKTVRSDKKDLDQDDRDDRDDIEETSSLFRAFGLLSGDVDLFDAVNDATGSGTLAYYSFEDRSITVRGTRLTRASRATVVHELTHALQDQKFDIGDRLEKLRKEAADGEPTTKADALNAIVEGDAERVADLYRKSLSSEEQKALAKAEATDTKDALKGLESVPQVIQALLSAPYALGEALTQTVASQDVKDLDRLFTDPPPDDSVLLDPLKALGGLSDPAEVVVPKAAKDEKRFDSGQVGALVTYLILAERIAPTEALRAADAWDGDAYLGFRRDGVACVRVTYATGSATEAKRLTSAFEGWISGAKGSTATIEQSGDQATFESCDPGTSTKLSKGSSNDALQLLATRSYIGSGAVESGAPATFARCYAQRIVDEYPLSKLTDPTFGTDDPAVTDRIKQLATDCSGQ